MTVITGVPTNLRVPQTFHKFSFVSGGSSLTPLAQLTCLIGTMKGGSAVAGTIYPVDDPTTTDGLCGVGTPLALMCRKAFDTINLMGIGAQLSMVGVAENAAGAARTQTFTLTGTATAAGNLVVTIAGRTVIVPVNLGDTAATVAVALNSAINALQLVMPGTSGVAAAVVTFTASTKGSWGANILFAVVTVPAGLTCVTAQGVAANGVQDETAALAAITGIDFDSVALENHDTTAIALGLSHVTAAWGMSEKHWRWLVYGENGSIGTATPLASNANHLAIVVGVCEQSPSLVFEMSTALACAITGKTRPNANWDGQQLPLYPPPDAYVFTGAEKESALAVGLVPLVPVKNPITKQSIPNTLSVVKMVTTQTSSAGQPFELLRDLAVPRAAAYMARQIDIAYVQRFSANADNPDGALLDDDSIDKVKDMIASIMYDAQAGKIIKNVDADLPKLIVETDPIAPGRLNIEVTYTVVIGLHQAAFVHRVTVGG